jgi:hypothetical protein
MKNLFIKPRKMKSLFITMFLILLAGRTLCGQSSDPLVGKCMANAGADAKYLKDFRVQLGKSTESAPPRYKANISLWKDMKYRFTLCNTEDSKGQLVVSLTDDTNKTVLTSFDKKNGKAYSSVDFICNKSGIYQVNYDFSNSEAGSGVGMISIVK